MAIWLYGYGYMMGMPAIIGWHQLCGYDILQYMLRLAQKVVIVINGRGGAGKDTICGAVAKYIPSASVSAITPIKELAKSYGWDGEKDDKSRKFLADLKKAFIDYDGMPNRYLENEYIKFMSGGADILFVHIREGSQIDDFKRRVPTKCITLLVRPPEGQGIAAFGNESDDGVENYAYDYCYTNRETIEAMEPEFMDFLAGILASEGALRLAVDGCRLWHGAD